MKKNFVLILAMVILVYGATAKASLVHQDDFSLDTTANYETFQLDYGTVVASVSVDHDAVNERANLTTVGGYNFGYMKTKQNSLISAHTDFDFSVDFQTISGFTTYLYLGDLQPLTSTCFIDLRANSHAHELQVVQRKDGAEEYLFRGSYSGTSGNIQMRRESGEYFFYFNGNLLFNERFEDFDEMALHYAVGNDTNSGPSADLTSLSAIDNWNMVPEPATLLLLGLGGLALRRKRS